MDSLVVSLVLPFVPDEFVNNFKLVCKLAKETVQKETSDQIYWLNKLVRKLNIVSIDKTIICDWKTLYLETDSVDKLLLSPNPDIVQLALDNGADVSKRRYNAFYQACQRGYLSVVKLFISTNLIPAIEQQYALHTTSGKGHLDVIKELVNNGVSLEANDCYSLKAASENGHLHIVEFLLDRSLDPNTLQISQDCITDSLKRSAEHGYVKIAELLLDRGADPSVGRYEPIRLAAANGHISTVKMLVKYGCDGLYGATENGHTEIVRILLDNWQFSELIKSCALCRALEKGLKEIADILTDHGATIDKAKSMYLYK